MAFLADFINKIRKRRGKDVIHYHGLIVAYTNLRSELDGDNIYLSDIYKHQPKEFSGAIYFKWKGVKDDLIYSLKKDKKIVRKLHVYNVEFHITDEILEKPSVDQVNMTNGYVKATIDNDQDRFIFSTKFTRSTVKLDKIEAIPSTDMNLIANGIMPGIANSDELYAAFSVGYTNWLNTTCREKYFKIFSEIPDTKIEFFEMAEKKLGLTTLINIYEYHHTPPFKQGYTKRFIQDVMTTCAASNR